MDHWRRGHKQICKKLHRGGNAEQYHADKKYKEAVALAVEACADDAPRADLQEAVAILEDLNPRARRVFGPQHPETLAGEFALNYARRKLAAVDTAPA